MSLFRSFLASVLALALLAAPAWALSNAGVYTLAAVQITTAVTASAQTAIPDLDGVTAASIECSFAYGSGGTTASATIQTSLDGGTTWRDVARCDFTTSTRVAYGNLSGLTAKNVASSRRWRLKVSMTACSAISCGRSSRRPGPTSTQRWRSGSRCAE